MLSDRASDPYGEGITLPPNVAIYLGKLDPMTQTCIVLIVDDSEIDREIFRDYLLTDSETQYEIFEADNAADGLALCQQVQCDVVLLDYRLPDMSGLEFLQRQQRQQALQRMPAIIMLTGLGDEQLAVQSLRAGAIDYLSKQELQPDDLITAVQYALRRQQLRTSRSSNIFSEAVAASILRFRRSLELQDIAESAVSEIRYLTRCDRVSIVQTAHVSDPFPIAQVQSVALTDYLRQYEATQQRRPRRGRPAKNRPTNLNALQSTQFPIQFLNERLPWGWVALDYLPDVPSLSEDEHTMFEALVDQLAIAIEQSEQYNQAICQIRELKALQPLEAQIMGQNLLRARDILTSLLLTARTLAKNRARLSERRQDQLLHQIERYSRDFIELLENFSSPPEQ